jgi:solute carrier family 35 (UDP-sugar transporter), member A1/2/3
MVPAGLYTVQNNLAYFAMSNLDAATYQLLYQLKILTTAIFSVILLKKSLNGKQWISLCVLCIGVGLVQASSVSAPATALPPDEGETDAGTEQHIDLLAEETKKNSFLGFLAVLAACCSSGLAGVYFEMVLKNAKTSLWTRNLQLSLFGMILGLLPVMNDWSSIMQEEDGFFHGYNGIVWIVVLLQAGGGILVAIVVKYADNILKGFATSLSIIMSCIASYFLFNFVVTLNFAIGAALILCAVYVYGNEANKPSGVSNSSNKTKLDSISVESPRMGTGMGKTATKMVSN